MKLLKSPLVFLAKLGNLLREGDTRMLELVMGSIASIIGWQFFLGLLGFGDRPALLSKFPFPMEFIVALILVILAFFKITGAVLEHTQWRMWSAMGQSSAWWALLVANFATLSPFAMGFLAIFALQSSWIYIRLSILRKRGHE